MDIELLNAQLVEGDHDDLWMLALAVTGDNKVSQNVALVLPAEALETLAAEYDMDPNDVDTLLNVAIWGAFAGSPGEASDPSSLFNAPTVDAARDALLAKISAVSGGKKIKSKKGKQALKAAGKSAVVKVDSDGDDPATILKAHSPLRAEVIDAKQYRRDQHRARLHHTRRAAAAAPRVTPGERLLQEVRDERNAQRANAEAAHNARGD